jgi:hypothetical protein
MSRFTRSAVVAIALAASLPSPAFAQRSFHGGAPFRRPAFHGPFFRGGLFFAPVPLGAFAAPYPVYPYPAQFAWYCANPAGYYPYVTACAVAWQAVPIG